MLNLIKDIQQNLPHLVYTERTPAEEPFYIRFFRPVTIFATRCRLFCKHGIWLNERKIADLTNHNVNQPEGKALYETLRKIAKFNPTLKERLQAFPSPNTTVADSPAAAASSASLDLLDLLHRGAHSRAAELINSNPDQLERLFHLFNEFEDERKYDFVKNLHTYLNEGNAELFLAFITDQAKKRPSILKMLSHNPHIDFTVEDWLLLFDIVRLNKVTLDMEFKLFPGFAAELQETHYLYTPSSLKGNYFKQLFNSSQKSNKNFAICKHLIETNEKFYCYKYCIGDHFSQEERYLLAKSAAWMVQRDDFEHLTFDRLSEFSLTEDQQYEIAKTMFSHGHIGSFVVPHYSHLGIKEPSRLLALAEIAIETNLDGFISCFESLNGVPIDKRMELAEKIVTKKGSFLMRALTICLIDNPEQIYALAIKAASSEAKQGPSHYLNEIGIDHPDRVKQIHLLSAQNGEVTIPHAPDVIKLELGLILAHTAPQQLLDFYYLSKCLSEEDYLQILKQIPLDSGITISNDQLKSFLEKYPAQRDFAFFLAKNFELKVTEGGKSLEDLATLLKLDPVSHLELFIKHSDPELLPEDLPDSLNDLSVKREWVERTAPSYLITSRAWQKNKDQPNFIDWHLIVLAYNQKSQPLNMLGNQSLFLDLQDWRDPNEKISITRKILEFRYAGSFIFSRACPIVPATFVGMICHETSHPIPDWMLDFLAKKDFKYGIRMRELTSALCKLYSLAIPDDLTFHILSLLLDKKSEFNYVMWQTQVMQLVLLLDLTSYSDNPFVLPIDFTSYSDNLGVKIKSLLRNLTSLKFDSVFTFLFKEIFGDDSEELTRKHDSLTASFSNRFALLIYKASLNTIKEEYREEVLSLFHTFFTSALEGTFYADRYQNSAHLELAFTSKPGLQQAWQSGERLDGTAFMHLPLVEINAKSRLDWFEQVIADNHLQLESYPLLNTFYSASKEQKTELIQQLPPCNEENNITEAFQRRCIEVLDGNAPFNQLLEAIAKLNTSELIQFERDIKDRMKQELMLSRSPSSQEYESEWEIIDTDDLETVLMSGTDVLGSCQRINGYAIYNRGLLGYLLNGHNRFIVVRNKISGKILGRCLFRLVFDSEGKSSLFQERLYYDVDHASEKGLRLTRALDGMTKHRAKALDLALYKTQSRDAKPEENPLKCISGKAPDYVDALRGIFHAPYSIFNWEKVAV